MDPDQAQWEDSSGETTLNLGRLTCRDDGTIKIESDSFSYEGTDPAEANQQFANLVKHGLERAQGQG